MYAVFLMTDCLPSVGEELDQSVQLFDDEASAIAWAVDLLVSNGELVKRSESSWGFPGGDGEFLTAEEALDAWQWGTEPMEFLHVYPVYDRRSNQERPAEHLPNTYRTPAEHLPNTYRTVGNHRG